MRSDIAGVTSLSGGVEHAPKGFAGWMDELLSQGMGTGFHADVATLLRLLVATRDGAVIFCTGTASVPYMDWLQDGMGMNSRLILHHESEKVIEQVRPHCATDIRIALHAQSLSSFLDDIEEHRFEFIVMDMDGTNTTDAEILIARLRQSGLLVAIGERERLQSLSEHNAATHFSCWPTPGRECLLMSIKGMQHHTGRRGGRRRRTSGGRGEPLR